MRPSLIIWLYKHVLDVTDCSFQDDHNKISHPTCSSYSVNLTHLPSKVGSVFPPLNLDRLAITSEGMNAVDFQGCSINGNVASTWFS